MPTLRAHGRQRRYYDIGEVVVAALHRVVVRGMLKPAPA